MSAECVRCAEPLPYTPAEGVDVTCSHCVLGMCERIEVEELARLSAVDTDDVKEARSAHGWTQEDLAVHLRIPKAWVSSFERGLRSCPRQVKDWLDQQ